jgi:superfamily II DNA or RNA helicase/HKD family nuclease
MEKRYKAERELLTGDGEGDLYSALIKEIEAADSIIIISAFISSGQHNRLIKTVEKAVAAGKTVRILTSTLNNFNRPDVLRSFCDTASEFRIFGRPGENDAFHVKSYLFTSNTDSENKNRVLIIGSSNFTSSGLSSNIEWNLILRNDPVIFEKAYDAFSEYWNYRSTVPDGLFFAYYEERYRETRERLPVAAESSYQFASRTIEPNSFQQQALGELQNFRADNISRALVIAATGTGKTYLAAMDYRQSGYERVLYLAHRKNILDSSHRTFQRIAGGDLQAALISGSTNGSSRVPDPEVKAVFGMVQTMSRNELLESWPPDFFDYIVIDEFHRAEAESYQRILSHFTPRFLLGMTATPERMDGVDVAYLCDHNIAFDMRLFEAIEENLLVPFYYFAIYDESDYSQVRWNGRYNESELEVLLADDTRLALVRNNLLKFPPSGPGKRKVLGFCAGRDHARFMRDGFNRMGITSELILGDTPEDQRTLLIDELKSENHPLEVLFSVDVFTEGIDIPEITHVLLLRPTESFTIFVQQIGRGLRHSTGKDHVVILDFVGNYRGSYIPHLILRGISSAREISPRDIPQDVQTPDSCFVDIDTEVIRVQNEELSRIFKKDRNELFELVYRNIRKELGRVPLLTDLIEHPSVTNITALIKQLGGNWLRVKQRMEDLSADEESLLDTASEDLLHHIEQELNPNKSYKMVVLHSLIQKNADTAGWSVDEIATDFKSFYLKNKRYLSDYTDMARSTDPEQYTLTKVVRHLKNNPLKFLSNKENSFFQLDEKENRFYLLPGENDILHECWNNPHFKGLAEERITYMLKRYFFRRNKD